MVTPQFHMAARPAASPPRLLRAARSLPAASRLKPAVLLSLQAFDAAVRLNSFKAAAEALHLTPSAVSHRIRNLEKTIGGPPFTRKPPAAHLTPPGPPRAPPPRRRCARPCRAPGP